MNLSTSGRSGRRTGTVSAVLTRHGTPPKFREQGRIRRRLQISSAFVALLALLSMGNVASPAFADDYPTWADVQAVKGDVAKTNEKIAQIQALIADLQVQVEDARILAEKRGAEYQAAQEAFDNADQRATDLQQQADESEAAATEATEQAGRLAAQLYRSGGNDLSMSLLLESEGAKADELLSKLGSMSKMVERSTGVYEQAQVAKNNAAALTAQAEVARAEREKLRIEAERVLQEAIEAQVASENALAAQQAQGVELDQMLQALQDKEAKTVKAYKEGVAERERQRIAAEKAERERRAAEAKAAAEAAAAAAQNSGGGGGGGGGSSDGGQLGGQGWALPVSGWISGNFGPRDVICSGGYCTNSYHRGTDIAAYCGAGIYAATSGRVSYAGWMGSYGNFILIDHGNGVQTGYAHIRPGGIYVGYGQTVSAGQNIASVGTTGASTGCHLHLEVRINGSAVNAVPFLGARGVWLG